nr:hypothetical protein [Tanacetum cinerariifolium]
MDKEAAAPTVTIKAKIDVFKEIREALTPTQVKVFEKTCLGHWLNVGLKKNSQLLIHTVLACMVEGKANELSFLVLGKHVQSEVVSEQLEIEKHGISKKKRKRGSSQSSLQDLTYDQLMTTITKLEGIVATLTETFLILHGTIGTLQSRLLALEGDERDFGVVSDGDIQTYMSPGPLYTSPASIAHKSLPLANHRKLRVRRTPLKLKSPMRCYSRKVRCTIPPPPSTTISVPMTTTKLLKDAIHTHLDDSDAAKDTHLDAATTISVPMTTTEAEYLEQGKLDGLHINAFIELMMRKRPRNAQWTLGLSKLVAFHIDSRKLMSMVLVVDALRATIDETNPRLDGYTSIYRRLLVTR